MRALTVSLSVLAMSLAIAGQLVHLALAGQTSMTTTLSHPIANSFARPDIVDRHGRLLATDVAMPSLFADPSRVVDPNVVVEKLSELLPGLDREALRRKLSDRGRRFVWVQRGVSPAMAQQIHNLGLPGLSFKQELKRAYPAGRLAGHVLGSVNIDNKGLSGIEQHIDAVVGADPVLGAQRSRKAPVQLSLDVGVQHALDDELARALRRYQATAAAGVVMDVNSGEVIAAASIPGVDPMQPAQHQETRRRDRVAGGSYELGSIFKAFTVAMALEAGLVTVNTKLDVTKPLVEGRHTIRDGHGGGRPLSVAEVFTHSSNVGAGLLALAAGPKRQKLFLDNFRLLTPIKTEAGRVAAPQLPEQWQRIEQITIAYGHGMAVSPLQFAAAYSALVNGGSYVAPTFLRRVAGESVPRQRVLSHATSRKMRTLMRLNVTDRAGTGGRADVPGYRVGGKTGTAEVASVGGYKKKTVISSFSAAFPMDEPRYVVLVSVFEPKGNRNSGGAITASRNAAPTTGRVIRRIAPLLNVMPAGTVTALSAPR
ncbi:MAG: penicillin-binding protein 2 [Alphaproteobacteria bacterium]|nr:penicillin-binding protein 2 [Alphaproteobacteria bacterium]